MADKHCNKCGNVKPIEDFPNDRSRIDGKYPYCKLCNRKKVSEWRSDNPDAFKRYYAENKDAVLAKTQTWRVKNREHTRQYAAEYYLTNKEAQQASSRDWKRRNANKVAAYNKLYKAVNAEKLIAQVRSWRSANKAIRCASESKRKAQKIQATPGWFEADKVMMLYEKAQRFGAHVDHVVPLNHPLVCGLHCWHNLQLLPPDINCEKGNRHWPDMP